MMSDPFTCYLKIEDILQQTQTKPSKQVIQNLQSYIFQLFNEKGQQASNSDSIIQIEKYFRQLVHKVEEYYSRRIQKIGYFVDKALSLQNNHQLLDLLQQRIEMYKSKKPWRLDQQLNYKRQGQKKEQVRIDSKNCNQVIDQIGVEGECYISGTSTPLSRYSNLPSFANEGGAVNESLNKAVYFDDVQFNFDQFDDEEQIYLSINQIQEQLVQIALDEEEQYPNPQTTPVTLDDILNEQQRNDEFDRLDTEMDFSQLNRVDEGQFLEQIDKDFEDDLEISMIFKKEQKANNIQITLNSEILDDKQYSNQPNQSEQVSEERVFNLQPSLNPGLLQTEESDIATKEIIQYVQKHKKEFNTQIQQQKKRAKSRDNVLDQINQSESPSKIQSPFSPYHNYYSAANALKRYRVKSAYDRSYSFTKNFPKYTQAKQIKNQVSYDNLHQNQPQPPKQKKKAFNMMFLADFSELSSPVFQQSPKKISLKNKQLLSTDPTNSNVYKFSKQATKPKIVPSTRLNKNIQPTVKKQVQQYHSLEKPEQQTLSQTNVQYSSAQKSKNSNSFKQMQKMIKYGVNLQNPITYHQMKQLNNIYQQQK